MATENFWPAKILQRGAEKQHSRSWEGHEEGGQRLRPLRPVGHFHPWRISSISIQSSKCSVLQEHLFFLGTLVAFTLLSITFTFTFRRHLRAIVLPHV